MMLILLKYIIRKFNELMDDIRGECNIDFTKNFTPEQSAAFDGFIDFLADMLEKYSPMLDDIIVDKQTA